MRTSALCPSLRSPRLVAHVCAAVVATLATTAATPLADATAAAGASATTQQRPSTHRPSTGMASAVHPPHDPAALPRGRVALNFALAQRGKPYAWGGTGPAVYDCSGLTQRAWRVAGVAIPRTTQQQARTGKAVPLNKIELGDLVIFYHDASHVGIYAGNGNVVVAPHQGARVTLEPMKWMPVYAVRRPG